MIVGYATGLDAAALGVVEAAHDLAREQGARGAPLKVGPFAFAVDRKLARGAYRLHNADCEVLVGLGEHEGEWDIEVTWRAIALATKGHDACFALGRQIAAEVRGLGAEAWGDFEDLGAARPIPERLRRIDPCADVTGFDASDPTRYVSRARSIGEYRVTSFTNGESVVTGLTFSQGNPLSARIYEKTLELQQQHGPDAEKTRTEHAAWSAAGWDGSSTVMRVEYQLRGEALRSMGIETPDDLTPEKLQQVWSYCTHDWLRRTAGGATRQHREQTDLAWMVVQNAWNAAPVPLKRQHGRRCGATLEQATGCVLSALAALGALPSGSTEATVHADLVSALEVVLMDRYSGKQLLVGIDGYRAAQVEIDAALAVGASPCVAMSANVRVAMRQRAA